MLDFIVGMLIALLCVAGAVSIIKWLALKISAPRDMEDRIYAIFLRGENADIELQMALETLEWESTLYYSTVYAVNCGVDEKTDKLCERMCAGSRVTYLKADQFVEIIAFDVSR